MKRLLAMSLAVLLILSGCGKVPKIKGSNNVSKNINTPTHSNTISNENDQNTNTSSQNISQNANIGVKKQESKLTGEEANKIENDMLQTSNEIDKLLDSLEDIDESKLN